jgi:hypothetical protein
LTLFDVVDELQRFLHFSRRDAAVARRPNSSVRLAILGLKGGPSDHAFRGIEPQPPLLAIRRGDLVHPRKVSALVRLAIAAEMELKERLASRQIKPMQHDRTVAEHAHHLDADHPTALRRLHLGQSGGEHKRGRIDRHGHADTKPHRCAASKAGGGRGDNGLGHAAPPQPEQQQDDDTDEKDGPDKARPGRRRRWSDGGSRRRVARLALHLSELGVELVELGRNGRVVTRLAIGLPTPLHIAGVVLVVMEICGGTGRRQGI